MKLQVDSHAAAADSSLTQLGDVSVQITAGLSWLFAEGLEAEFSFSEDIAVDTAPDFVLQLGIRYQRSDKRWMARFAASRTCTGAVPPR